jgi:hypothetical protein
MMQASSVADDDGIETPQDVSEEASESADTPTNGDEDAIALLEVAAKAGCDDMALVDAQEEGEISVPLQALCRHGQMKKPSSDHGVRYPPITGTAEERCLEAIQHVTKVVLP